MKRRPPPSLRGPEFSIPYGRGPSMVAPTTPPGPVDPEPPEPGPDFEAELELLILNEFAVTGEVLARHFPPPTCDAELVIDDLETTFSAEIPEQFPASVNPELVILYEAV